MLTTAYEKLDGNYGRWSVVREVDEAVLCRAREIFSNYKQRGIILNDSFDDPAWKFTNQVQNVGLTLIPFEGHFHRDIGWIGCDHRCYQDSVKAYIAFSLGEIDLSTLRELSKTLISLAGSSSEEAAASSEYMQHIINLLQILPGGSEDRDWVIETLEERAEHKNDRRKGKQRQLADFNTYLRFNDSNFAEEHLSSIKL